MRFRRSQQPRGRFRGRAGAFHIRRRRAGGRAETVFDVASLTKVVATTAVAMVLSQRGELDIDMPLGELLPGFVVGREAGDAARLVKLGHLLAHNSGLPGYAEFFRTATTPAQLFRACLELQARGRAGQRGPNTPIRGSFCWARRWRCCTREYLATWVRREIFAPLGMTATWFCPPQSLRAAIPPTEEDRTLRHRRIQGEVQDENAWVLKGAAGHAGLFSNVPDLLRFAAAILDGAGTGPAGGEDEVRLLAGRRWSILRGVNRPREVRALWVGIRLRNRRHRVGISRSTRSGTWAIAGVRCGSTWRRRLRWCYSPTEPGQTGRAS